MLVAFIYETLSKIRCQHLGWHWLRLAGNMGRFHIYFRQSHIYAYEPGLLYQMSFGSYFGEGIRYALVARSEISHHLLVIAKLASTDYFDRTHTLPACRKLPVLIRWI